MIGDKSPTGRLLSVNVNSRPGDGAIQMESKGLAGDQMRIEQPLGKVTCSRWHFILCPSLFICCQANSDNPVRAVSELYQ